MANFDEMHSNRTVTIGHHSCKKGHEAYILKNAPFKSVMHRDRTTKKMIFPYLGDGYYFWDDNIELAKFWGEKRYNGEFSTIEIEITLEGSNVLDLVGSRQHLRYILQLIKELETRQGRNIGIGEAIEVLKQMNSSENGIFEFTIFRAIDVTLSKSYNKFELTKKGDIYMDPAIMICYIDKKDVPLQTVRIV